MPFEASYLGYAFASAALVYAAVAWFGDRHLSQEYKENLTLWLWGEYESSWSYHYCKFFDAVFGERHLSWRCFFRSTIASIFAVLFFYLLFAEMLSIMQPGGRAGGYLPLAQVALFGILINIIPDYISLYETRWLLKRFGRAKGIHRQLGILIVDLVVTTLIIAPVIALFQWLIGEEGSSIVEIAAVFSAYSLFFYSTFLTSLWAWIFFLSTWLMKIFCRTPLRRLLDVEDKPVAQVALLGSVLLFLIMIIFRPVFEPISKKEVRSIDIALCKMFPGEICKHLPRLTTDEAAALDFLAQACQGGDTAHCFDTAIRYFSGDPKKAFSLFAKACDAGNAVGCFNSGVQYDIGQGVTQDQQRAAALFSKACTGGVAKGCFNAGVQYDTGKGVTQDQQRAAALFSKACTDGEAKGCFNAGVQYEMGQGVPQDQQRAAALFSKACHGGHAEGCFSAGVQYDIGKGVTQDRERAAALFSKACTDGHAEGCFNAGVQYDIGQGVTQDRQRAAALFSKACAGGEAKGCFNAGVQYETGKGVTQDQQRAAALFLQACAGGEAKGCFNAGIQYDTGKGVKQDRERAAALFSKACTGGETRGCARIGTMRL